MRRVLQVIELFLVWFWFLGRPRLPRKSLEKDSMIFVRPRLSRPQLLNQVTQI